MEGERSNITTNAFSCLWTGKGVRSQVGPAIARLASTQPIIASTGKARCCFAGIESNKKGSS